MRGGGGGGGGYDRQQQQYGRPGNNYNNKQSPTGGLPSPISPTSLTPAANPNGPSSTGNFYDQVDHTKRTIERIQKQMERIRSLQSRILNSTTTDESDHYTTQLDQLTDETSAMLQSVRKTLKQMSAETSKLPPGAEQHSRKGQQGSLAKKLMSVAEEYQQLQTSFKQRYKQRMEREIRIAQPNATEADIQRAIENPQQGSAFASQLMSSRSAQQRKVLEDVQTRHQELQKIEQSINELFALFQEMQLLLDVSF
jgi:syntaxin 1B/2/3